MLFLKGYFISFLPVQYCLLVPLPKNKKNAYILVLNVHTQCFMHIDGALSRWIEKLTLLLYELPKLHAF